MKNPFGEVHKKELAGWYLVVDIDDIAIIHEPFCESEADFLVAAINGFETGDKNITDQQAVINALKVENANLAIVVQENSELHHKQIADLQGRIKQLVKALEHISEYWNQRENDRAMNDALYHIIETADVALAAAKELI